MIELTACLTMNATTIQRRISINPLHIAVVREDHDRAQSIIILADSNNHRYTVAEPYDVVMMRLFEALHPGELPAIMTADEAEAALEPIAFAPLAFAPEAIAPADPTPRWAEPEPRLAESAPPTRLPSLFSAAAREPAPPATADDDRWPPRAAYNPWKQQEPEPVRYELEEEPAPEPTFVGVSDEQARWAQTRALLAECVAMIEKYLTNDLTVSEFKVWFRPRWTHLRESGDPVAHELDYTVGTLLALFASNTYGEDAFKYLLRKVHGHMLETLTRANGGAAGRVA